MFYTNEDLKKKIIAKEKKKQIFNIIIYIIVTPILVYNISLIIQAIIKPNATPSFLGIKTYVVVSGSMEPEIKIGDIVVAKSVKSEELQIGDIICFRQSHSIITHRIVEINKTSSGTEYKTKGDNNNTQDIEAVNEKQVEGKVINKIPALGNISLLLQNKIAIIIIIVMFYIYIISLNRKKKKKSDRYLKRLKHENKMKGL